MLSSRIILPVIVTAQFLCTSVWFAGNAMLTALPVAASAETGYLAHLTSAVQSGFIIGTLVFALLSVADRFSPSRVFFCCAIVAALSNVALVNAGSVTTVLLLRFATGFFLAGIYPVGMKIAADHFRDGLGRSLGFLVGALVLGSALPHLLRGTSVQLPWQQVLITTSILCAAGGAAIGLLVPDGPYRRQGQALQLAAGKAVFREPGLRAAALGYFGHMWELYTFWAFAPAILKAHFTSMPATRVSMLCFLVIGSGAAGCIIAGLLTKRFAAITIAKTALIVSGICCLFSPLLIQLPTPLFLTAMFVWGITVIADSPLFSTIVAQRSSPQARGSVITLVTSIGFAITIVSIQFINAVSAIIPFPYTYLFLAAGPVAGVLALTHKKRTAIAD